MFDDGVPSPCVLLVYFFSSQIDQATTENAIDQILQDPAKMAIVNSSRWLITKPINVHTKSELVQEIMVEELLSKRGDNIRAFQNGLSVMEFMTFCHKHPTLTKELFVYRGRPLTASVFLQPPVMSKRIRKPDHSDVDRVNSFNWFMKYINERSNSGEYCNLASVIASVFILLYLPKAYIHNGNFTVRCLSILSVEY